MNEVTTIGLDLAKNVFQVHGIDVEGGVIIRRQLRRSQMLASFGEQPAFWCSTLKRQDNRTYRFAKAHVRGHVAMLPT